MSVLPKISHTLYEHALIGLGKTVKYRAFTNAEQKTLLLAKEAKGTTDERTSMLNAVKQIVDGCTNGKLSADELSTFDLEDLFMRIRAKSVGEIITVKYRYDYESEDKKPLSKFVNVDINIDDIKVTTDPKHEKKIQLTPTVGIMMKYPTFAIIESVTTNDQLPMMCIDYIYDENEIYDTKTVTAADLKEFYDDIQMDGLLKIKQFFDTMPKLSHTVQVDLGDGVVETVKFSGLEDFFI